MNKNTIPQAALLYPPPKHLQRNGRLETASTQTCVERSRNTKPTSVGFKTLILP
ncbi:hypothetical protein WKK05_21330 [Nostoc sp. UHCC 0302]|uniref:hypothetical protein n=1 Tax=Nostoc sp. UHCC 0302 TaxID=3134896 RepID=UPI00311CDD7C